MHILFVKFLFIKFEYAYLPSLALNTQWCADLAVTLVLICSNVAQQFPFSGIICLVFSVNIGLVPRIFSCSYMLILEDLVLVEKSKGFGVLA